MSQLDRVLVQMAVSESVLGADELERALDETSREAAETILRRRGVSEESLARLVRLRDEAWSEATKRALAQLERQLLATAAGRRGIAVDGLAGADADFARALAHASPEGEALVNGRESRALACPCGLDTTVLCPPGEAILACPVCDAPFGMAPAAPAFAPPSTAAGWDTDAPTVVSNLSPRGVDPKAATAAVVVGDAPTGRPGSWSAPAPAPSSASSSTPSRKLPERVGPYEVIRVLGAGGMGAVLEARESASGRRVALKTIHQSYADEAGAEARFQREGKVLSLLAHPNVVRFVDRGHADGITWIAMELVEGRSLAERLTAGKLPVGEGCRIGRALAEGLAYAHALGLVHRDVKPGNVLLGKRGEVKLADFGLARRRDESLVLTRQGDIVGTPLYMAPEQLDGLPATPAVDLFALGAVLFHAIAGEPPFTGSFAQLAFQRTQGRFPRLRDKLADVPAGLDALVASLLARKPTDRPTAAEVARALSKWEDEAPVADSVAPTIAVADPRSFSQGSKLGAFTIEGKLGAGGMGAVFRARRADGQVVALKLVAHGLDADAAKRFAREARALTEVQSENVVRLLDAGEAQGLGWIAMELVEGRSLDALIAAEGPLPEKRLLDVGDAVANGLAALHAKGIVHRDVKPQNIMVGPDGKVTLVDLGLAKFLAARTAVTETGALVGTPHYMAPEQLTGGAVDARTDLYALGASLYHAATGKRPFDGDTTTAIAFQQVHAAARPVRKLNPGLSAPTARVIDRLLEKRPDRRPASALEARELFARARAGKSPDVGRVLVARLAGGLLAFLAVATVALVGYSAITRKGLIPILVSQSSREQRGQPDEFGKPAPKSHPEALESPGPSPNESPTDRPAPTSNGLAVAKPGESGGGAAPRAPSIASAEGNADEKADAARAPEVRPQESAPATQRAAPQAKKTAPGNAPARQPVDDLAGQAAEKDAAKDAERSTEEQAQSQGQLGEKPASGSKNQRALDAAPVDSLTRGFLALGVELTRTREGVRYTRRSDHAPMVLVHGGKFIVGSESQPRPVTLGAFLIDAEEVSVARWKRFQAAKRAAGKRSTEHFHCLAAEPETTEHRDCLVESASDDPLPARGIGVWDAAAYAGWAAPRDACRLPTAAEWEAAARTPDLRDYPWGNGWKAGNARSSVDAPATGPGPVDSPAGVSFLGLKNLSGNVAEWTLDFTSGGADAFVHGGSWQDSTPENLRLGASVNGAAVNDLATVGFRCVVPLPPELAR